MQAARGNLASIYAEAERALAQRHYRRAHELCIRALEAEPSFAGAYFLLGVLAGDHGNVAKALELMDRAIGIEPDVSRYHAHRGRYLLALARIRDAYEAVMRAQALGPTDALTFDTIGVVLSRVGAHEEAVAPFMSAVQRSPGNASYQYNLGASLQFVGDFAGAERAFRAALAADPGAYRAWSSLAQLRRAPFSADDVAALERALAASDDPDAELHLCHALAKHAEDQDDYARAFAYLERGKAKKRAALDYSFAADAALFDAALRAADAPAGGGYASAEPIFVVGMPRTGTTLVERMLSSHPDVFSAGELMNFGLAVKRMAGTPSNRVLDEATLAAAAGLDHAELGKRYVESTRPRTGNTPRFIDKLPLNFFYVDLIRRALPAAKIICVRRDPLDTCLSNYRQLFSTAFSHYDYAYDLLDTGRFYLAFDALASEWARRHAGTSYTEVRYEDLVEHTEREARRLVAFCGLAWTPACLEFQSNTAPVATASSVQVRQPIYRTAVGRWRKYAAHLEPLRALLETAGSGRAPSAV